MNNKIYKMQRKFYISGVSDTVAALIAIALIIALFALIIFLPTIIMWLAWTYVAVAIFSAPVIGFWQMFLIWLALAIIGGLFKTTVTKSSN